MTTENFGEGIFDMPFINDVNDIKDLALAKTTAMEKIASSKARDANKAKARSMVQFSKTHRDLIFGMTNFSLSHQGLKTL